LISRDSNNSKLKAHYKSYCLVLPKVIKAAEQLYYNNKTSKSNNNIKTTWGIIETETCKNHLINIDVKLITNQQSSNLPLTVSMYELKYRLWC